MATSVAAHAGTARPQSWLVFVLGPYVMCASAFDVEGIVTHPQAIAKVPFAPDYALGAFLFRGSTAAAISLRKKFRLPELEHPETSPFVVARIADAVIAFSVDEVRDVLDEKDLEWRNLPSSLASDLFDRLAIHEGSLILQTSFAALRDIDVDLAPLAAWLPPLREGEPCQPGPAMHAAANELGTAVKRGEAEARASAVLERETTPNAETEIERHKFPSPQRTIKRGPVQRMESRKTRIVLPSTVAGRPNAASHERASFPRHPRVASPRAILAAPRRPHVPSIASRYEQCAPDSDGTRHDFSAAEETARPRRKRGARRLALAGTCGVAALLAGLYLLLPGSLHQGTMVFSMAPSLPSSGVSASAGRAALSGDVVPSVDRLVGATVAAALENRDQRGAAAQTATPGMGRTHTVVRGETLWGIAKKEAGDPFRYPELAKLSDIANPDLIRPGEVVRIR